MEFARLRSQSSEAARLTVHFGRRGLIQRVEIMDVGSLIAKYEKTVLGVETQSCDCGGVLRVGDAWRSACGWSPEYINDIEVRSDIERLLRTDAVSPAQSAQVAAIDWRLKKLLAANGVSAAGEGFWRNGLPLGVAE